MRILSSNLLLGRADVEAYGSLLECTDPDVVVCQELGQSQADLLADRYEYVDLHPSEEFVGRGVASRLPIQFGTIDMPGRTGTYAAITTNEGVWNMAGIHLVNPIRWPQWKAVRTRTAQLDALEAWADELGSGPQLVVGDFNASPRWPAYRRVASRWTDLVAEAIPRPERTWGWRPGWPLMLRIDHVFGTGVQATEVSVHPIAGSDHRAVLVELTAG